MKRAVILLLLVVIGFSALSVGTAAAWDIFPQQAVDCAGTGRDSAVCNSQVNPGQDPISGSGGILARITNVVALVAGMAAIIVLMVGGIRYITSDGDASHVKSAKSTVIYALIGLGVIVTARALVIYVVLRLAGA